MSSFTESEAKSVVKSLATIASALSDLRDLKAAKLELGVGENTGPTPLPGQIPLDAACEHRVASECVAPFGAISCDDCPNPRP